MKQFGDIYVLLVITLCFISLVKCDITLNGTHCGQKKCERGWYCSAFQRTCEPCTGICDAQTHNYDETLCSEKCQDYIHDSLYVLKTDNGTGNSNAKLKETVQRLSYMVTINLTLVCLMLIVLAAVLCFQAYRWSKKKNITLATMKSKLFSKKPAPPPNNKMNTISVNSKPDLHLEIPEPLSGSENTPVTTTTSISRRPAEDSTLDYAYDNPAMSASPTNRSADNRL